MEWLEKYWYYPIIALIFFTGVLLTIKLRAIQFRKSGKSLKLMIKDTSQGNGEVSTFGALCISLSATIGTGNIIGVASALAIGGAGALFWMIIVSILGLSTKYAEGFLAVKYRKVDDEGKIIGGPYAYIEYGLGNKWIPLAKLFAFFGAAAAILGIGTMTQSNGISDSFVNLIGSGKTFTLFNSEISIVSIIIGIIITILVTLVLIGGIKRISKVCEYIVPIMAVLYVLICLIILILNIKDLPFAVKEIFRLAFNTKAAAGGVMGYVITKAITSGVSKGIFANEAGLGSTPIALATAKNNDPVKQGLISMGGMIVTIIICTMTGLVVTVTNAYSQGLEGIDITLFAFKNGLGFNMTISSILLLLCIVFFAFTTIIGWNLYGMKCIAYLTNNNKIASKIYLVLYIIMVFVGSFLRVGVIWTVADIANSLMAIPNLIALIMLSNKVKKDTLAYDFKAMKQTEDNDNIKKVKLKEGLQ